MPSHFFPPVEKASPQGLVAVGGKLTTPWLLDAYRHGIFPWPSGDDDEPMLWWSPDPRAILPLDGVHASRRLERRMRNGEFEITLNAAFDAVIRQCAVGPGRERGTWLTPAMIDAYCTLHEQGHAHSLETWHEGELAGGVYGVAIGGFFSAESMFYRVRDASKAAVIALASYLRFRGFQLLDIQQWTPHTGRLGAIEIPRREYLKRLAAAVDLPVTIVP